MLFSARKELSLQVK